MASRRPLKISPLHSLSPTPTSHPIPRTVLFYSPPLPVIGTLHPSDSPSLPYSYPCTPLFIFLHLHVGYLYLSPHRIEILTNSSSLNPLLFHFPSSSHSLPSDSPSLPSLPIFHQIHTAYRLSDKSYHSNRSTHAHTFLN